MKKLIYIAAPYTNPDPVANTGFAIWTAQALVDLGFTPVIPHLNLLWHLLQPHPPEFWYAYDLEILARCDALLRIGGESPRADKEVEYAKEHSIPVFYAIKELQDYDQGKSES